MKERLLGLDKLLHVGACAGITLVVCWGTGDLAYAVFWAVVIAVDKEMRDEFRGGSWSWWDLAADAVGIAGAAAAIGLG